MVNFLLLIEKAPKYSKIEIDQGKNPKENYQLCSCIRETFCLSYNIRKNNNLYLYFLKDHIFIKFEGKSLRYLSSDERSQALLLLKALNKAKQHLELIDTEWIKSTPGIFVRYFSNDITFFQSLQSILQGFSILISDNQEDYYDLVNLLTSNSKILNSLEDLSFIIPNFPISRKNPKFLTLIKSINKIQKVSLPNIKKIEDKILLINYRIDQLKNN